MIIDMDGVVPVREMDQSMLHYIGHSIKNASIIVISEARSLFTDLYRDPYKFRVLLIGETGSGKTSFLNLLCNSKLIEELGTRVDGAKLSRIEHYNDLKIENLSDRAMESKTSDTKLYKAEICQLKSIVIDTPGFGDSRGLEKDKENVQKIIDALKKEDYINCVCLIINGRQSRMSASLEYVLSEISTILPKEIFDNIIVVFTNSADALDSNFDIRELESIFDQKIVHEFYIENPYCRIEKAKQKAKQLSNDQIAKSLAKSFMDTAECLRSIHDAIKDFKEVHTFHFIDLYNKKQEIEKDVIKILVSYDEQTDLEKQIKIQEEEIDAALMSEKLFTDFKTTRKVEVTKAVDTPDKRHNTLCGAPGCYSNCHIPCYLPKTYDQEIFKTCACMGGTETCQICGHTYRLHYHNEVIFKKFSEEKEFIDETMKSRFLQAANTRDKANVLRQGLQEKREDLLRTKNSLLQELSDKITEFQQLGISQQNYAKVLEKQCDVVRLRIEAATGDDRAQLNAFKAELEKKLEVVITALKQLPSD